MINKDKNGLVVITLEVSGDEFKNYKKNVLATYKDKEVDGFRKGKVPADVLEKNFEGSIKNDIVVEIVNDKYVGIITSEKLFPISDPILVEANVEKDSAKIVLEVAVEPEFELPKYKGLNVALETNEVTDEIVEKELENIALRYSNTIDVEKNAQNGDNVNINFEGFVDGTPFEGGKAEGYELVLGTKSFIDNFEDQIVGHNVGDEFDVNVVFPENYHAENLKGKKALFKVKLNGIKRKEAPKLDDELAKKFNLKTIDELRENIKNDLKLRYEMEAKNKKLNTIIEKLVKDVEKSYEVPKSLIQAEANKLTQNLANQLKGMYNIELNQYLSMTGMDIQKLNEQHEKQAENNLKVSAILNKILKAEKVDLKVSDLEKEILEDAKHHGVDYNAMSEDEKRSFEAHVLSKELNNKVMDILLNNN